jgi:thiamine monophosphate kinase
VNVSDALAMGAKPLHFLVTVGVPATIGAGVMEELYRGMGRAACESRAAPAGGETTEAARALFIDVSVPLPIVGEVSHDRGRASWRKGRKGTLP